MLRAQAANNPGMLRGLRPGMVAKAAVKTIRLRLEHRHYVRLTNTERGRNLAALGEDVFRQLSTDDDFFRQFDDSVLPD
jgi:hypothetical protein